MEWTKSEIQAQQVRTNWQQAGSSAPSSHELPPKLATYQSENYVHIDI